MQRTGTAPTGWTLIRGIRQLLTLRGPSGPRRGTLARVLDVIPDAAILVQDGLIQRIGRARGVENAREARDAVEMDLRGATVLPGFVEPDAAIVPLGFHLPRKQRETATARAAGEMARYGYLAAGAHTAGADDFREVVKILRAVQNSNLRPVRLRSVLSLPFAGSEGKSLLPTLTGRWLPAARKRRLTSIVEIMLHDGAVPMVIRDAGALMEAAEGLGFAVRFRSLAPLTAELAQFAAASGGIAMIAPLVQPGSAQPHSMASSSGSAVCIVPCASLMDSPPAGQAAIAPADEALAVSAGNNGAEAGSVNPQLLLYLATSRLGMTPEEAITAMTWNAACSLRMSNQAGCIDTGRSADLVAFDVPVYSELVRRAGNTDVSLVIRGGRIIYSRADVNPTFPPASRAQGAG